jgi:ABC-2 type transport system ATP-binding protein
MSEFYDIEREQISKRIQHYADVLNIGDKLNISLPAMSSGQRKRVMIIQSLINDPDVLVMDEPTENLDPDNREVFYKIMEELKKEGKTIFVSTHNLAEFEAYATYCVIIAEGKIQHEGPVTKKEGLRKIYDKYRPKLAIEMSGKILYKD